MRALACIAAAVLVVSADGQFMSTFMSSSSWVQGPDGRMHQQVHEVKTSIEQQGGGLTKDTSEVDCIDGRCRERDSVVYMPQNAARAPWGGMQAPPSLRGYLNSFFGPLREMPVPREVPDAVLIGPIRVANEAQQASKEMPVQQVSAPPEDPMQLSMTAVVVAAAFAGMGVLVTAAGLLRLWIFSAGAEARELQFNNMAEPLATADSLPVARVGSAVAATTATATVSHGQEMEDLQTPQEIPFELKPSVGTWLCQRRPADDEANA
eukprot:CAMPEP_0117556980 /NCGR_PEP_ID=MMETSP0784-20121206/52089_1 /TAXON_ID=39447 /ORGANISM="" /LENGTH=264 /DNA_ID=CAMNT_0005354273 /DNA_START=30 /DNA_END=824 /DNA_ORIENTATION=+